MTLVANLSCFSSATMYLSHVYLLLAFQILSVEQNHCAIGLNFAAHAQGRNNNLSAVFRMKLGASAKQNVNGLNEHFCVFHIFFYIGRTTTFLSVSTMPGVHEYLPSDVVLLLAQKNTQVKIESNDRWFY